MNKFTLHFTILGDCPIKKNAAKTMWFRTDHLGNRIPMKFPLHIWSDKYKEWASKAVQELALQKLKLADKLDFPLMGSYFVSYWIFKASTRALAGTKGVVDLSNLIEAPQDLLAGNAGNFLDKVITVNKQKQTVKYEHSLYQILIDDNCNVVTSLGTSHVFYDPVNPRTEIFITPYDITTLTEYHYLIHGSKLDNTLNFADTKNEINNV